MTYQTRQHIPTILSNHQEWLRLVMSNQFPLTENERNLRGDISGLEFEDTDFSDCDLSYMNLENTTFTNCKFINTNLKGAWACYASFENCLMILTNLRNVYGT